MKYLIGLLTALFLVNSAAAHGPTRQKVEHSIVIDATTDQVWTLISDFGAWHEWLPMVEAISIDGDTRVLDLGEGKSITEVIKKIKPEKMSLSYKITDMSVIEEFSHENLPVTRKVLPVDTYSSVIKVNAEGEGSKVTWTGKFYRGYLLNPPTPEGMSDEDAKQAISAIYTAGLDALKALIEK